MSTEHEDDPHKAEQTALIRALVEARRHFARVEKDGVNPHLHNRYATLGSVLDAVTVPLLDQGIFLTQTPVPMADGWAMKTTLAHTGGGELVGLVPIEYGEEKGLKVMQAMGSAISYARRYGLLSLLCLTAEDDDGATAGNFPARAKAPAGNGRAAATPTKPDPSPAELRQRQEAAFKKLQNDPPTDGRGLFGMVVDLDPPRNLLAAVNDFGRERKFKPKLVEWTPAQVAEAVRFIREEMEAAALAEKELD